MVLPVSPLLRHRVTDSVWPILCAAFFGVGAVALHFWPPTVAHSPVEAWLWTAAAASTVYGIVRPEVCWVRVFITASSVLAPVARALYWVALCFQYLVGRGGRWGPLAVATWSFLALLMVLHPPVRLPLSNGEVKTVYEGTRR